jgi:tetratricopeptide (TPR) repeat protein
MSLLSAVRGFGQSWRIVITISSDEFTQAVRHHQAGNLDAAARLYESVLRRDRAHADALHLLGVVRHHQGQSRLATHLIAQATALRPEVAVFHASLAEAHRALGQLEDAVAQVNEAVRLGLDDPAATNNLGLALHALGRHREAADAFQKALQKRPNDALLYTNLGAALHASGERGVALEHFNRAVELDPHLAPARTNLGQFLLDFGLPDEALPHCQAAVALRPDLAEAHNNLGNVYRALGQLGLARCCYAEAVRLNPQLAQAHPSLGLTLQQEGRWDEAIVSFRRATEIEPSSLPYLALLAEAAVDRERFAEAIGCYKKLLELDPGNAAAHNALGWLLQEEGRLEESEEQLTTALRLRPDQAIAHVNLGGLHEKRGHFAAAEASFRTALQDAEAQGPALARLALLLRGKLPENDRRAIQSRLDSSSATDPCRVNLLFGMAGVWDALERYAEAAACAREANVLAMVQFQRRNLWHEPEEHTRFVSGLIEAFNPALFARLSGSGLETKRPVFIVGLPRSGTTLIEQILASHSRFLGAGELSWVRKGFQAIPEELGRDEPPVKCVAGLTSDVVRRLAIRYDEQLDALDPGHAPRVIDKMPDNYIHLGLISLLFPNAVLIHCRRDLRDVAVSCWLTGFRSVHWTNDPRQIAARFQQYERLMNHWRAVVPSSIHEVNYEETVDDVEGVARRLLAACEMDWEPACLDFHRTSRTIRTASFSQVRQPVYRSSIGRWKNYENYLADLFAALAREAA